MDLKNLLKSSILVSRLLVSDKVNRYGEYAYLGVTDKQRKRLVEKLNEFDGKEYVGDLREGQSFLEGSIAVIRETLNDYNRLAVDK